MLNLITGGAITLNNSDPFAYPIVDLNLLSEVVDTAVLREGVRSTRRLMSAPVFADSVFESVFPASNITSDEDIDAFIRAEAGPYSHGGCSAGMSRRGASWGVVDPDYKVKGATGLRVVDASIFVSDLCLVSTLIVLMPVFQPRIPSGHTKASVYTFAERASAMIAEEWK
jgi:choline dehydrogenase-like flavoprotein